MELSFIVVDLLVNDKSVLDEWLTIHDKEKSLPELISLIPQPRGSWGTTDYFKTSFLHFSLFYTALWDLANSGPVHSLMLSSHLFFCLPSSDWQDFLSSSPEKTAPIHKVTSIKIIKKNNFIMSVCKKCTLIFCHRNLNYMSSKNHVFKKDAPCFTSWSQYLVYIKQFSKLCNCKYTLSTGLKTNAKKSPLHIYC